MRSLGIFEKTTVNTNVHTPVNIVTTLEMVNAPSPEILQQAIETLQQRHPLLRAQVASSSKPLQFEPASSTAFGLHILSPDSPQNWVPLAETEMMRIIDLTKGPLFCFHYFYHPDAGQPSNLVMTFHHSIIDGPGLINLIDEMLATCAALQSGEAPPYPQPRTLLPTPETNFPPEVGGINFIGKLLGFAWRQFSDELRFYAATRRKPKLTVKPQARNKIISISFSKTETAALLRISRQRQLTLNSLLNAAMLIVIWRRFLQAESLPVRTFTFVDLRPYLSVPTAPQDTAPHTAMLRYTIDMYPGLDLLTAAQTLNQEIYQSFKRGEKFISYALTDKIMKAAIAMKNVRMAATALSYSGTLDLAENYGEIQLKKIHGFISTPDFGPVLAGQAGILHQKLFIDLIYQDTDMEPFAAHACAQEVKHLLLSLV